MGPLAVTLYHQEREPRGLCEKVVTAQSPPGVGEKKYDETEVGMIAMLKYGAGMPFKSDRTIV